MQAIRQATANQASNQAGDVDRGTGDALSARSAAFPGRQDKPVAMSLTALRRELLSTDPDANANGLRRVARQLTTDSVTNERPVDWQARRNALAEYEPRLLALAQSDDATLRELAADALGGWQGAAALELLLKLAEDPSDRVRASAVGALEAWPHDARVVDVLLNAGLAPHWTVRSRAARALAKMPGSDVDSVLLECLVDPDGFVRINAAESLKQRDPAVYLERLRRMADYPAPHLLDGAMDLLGAVGNETDAKWLQKAGSLFNLSQPPFIRDWARKAARQIRLRQKAK